MGSQNPITFAIEVAIYRMGSRPDTNMPEKLGRKWEMASGPIWQKNGHRTGKMDPNIGHYWLFFCFCHLSISAAIFQPCRAWGHFPFSSPFFWDFCVGPVSHSVNGHFDRNITCFQGSLLQSQGAASTKRTGEATETSSFNLTLEL